MLKTRPLTTVIATNCAVAILVLLATASPLAAQVCRDCPETARDSASMTSHVYPALGLRVGAPQKVSGAIGIIVGTDWQQHGKDHSRDAALFIEPGLDAVRVSMAYLTGVGSLGSGFGLGASVLRTWKEPWSFNANTTYAGVEAVVWPIVMFGPRIGVFRRITGDARAGRWFVSADIGFGL